METKIITPSATRLALEAALVADPDDFTLHSAYADLLIEEGDPRGEYIRLQLLLEDRNQPVEQLREWEQQAYAIRLAHEDEWTEGLTTLHTRPKTISDFVRDKVPITWRRGWVDTVSIRRISHVVRNTIASGHIFQLLTELEMQPPGFDEYWDLHLRPLLESQIHRTIRCFRYHLGPSYSATPFAWKSFCESIRLPRLEVLEVGLDNLGTEGVEQLLRAKFFPQLQELNLSNCELTDDAADLLASNAVVRRMRRVTLDGNHFSPIGLEALREAGITVGPQIDNPGWDANDEV